MADLLLITGKPHEDLSIVITPNETLMLIMKDGQINRDTAK